MDLQNYFVGLLNYLVAFGMNALAITTFKMEVHVQVGCWNSLLRFIAT